MRQGPFNSLIVKISLLVVVVEAVALAGLGLYYIDRFSQEIDRRVESQIRLPGTLMNRQLLRYESVSNKEVMTELVGEEFEDGLLVGADRKVYYAFNPEELRQTQADIAWLPQSGEDSELAETRIFRQRLGTDSFLICATPIVPYEGADPVFFAYIKVSTKQSEASKRLVRNLFIFGSLLCILLTSTAIIFFIRKVVVAPIDSLRVNVEHVASGNPEQTIDVRRDDEIGALTSSFVAMRDVIRRNIEDLRQAEERYRKMFENALEGIFQMTPEHGDLLHMNTAMTKILGFESVEAFDESEHALRDYLFPNPADWDIFVEQLAERERVFGLEIQGMRQDGGQFWGLLSVRSVHDSEEGLLYYEGFLIDISEVKERERFLKEQEKAEQERDKALARREFITTVSQKTSELAKVSHNNMLRMDESMSSMRDASNVLSEKLREIDATVRNISSMVTTITKVADQTNLLSLNAAIEAEKAGEYGRGFAVVAREIRRLADQTAVATLDIEEMAQVMQTAVSAGVLEVDRFTEQVSQSSEDITLVSRQLTGIIEQVQRLMSEDTQNHGK